MSWRKIFGLWEDFRAERKKIPAVSAPPSAQNQFDEAVRKGHGFADNARLRQIMQEPDCDMELMVRCIAVSNNRDELLHWVAWQGWYLTLRAWFEWKERIRFPPLDHPLDIPTIIPSAFLSLCRETLDEHDANQASIVGYCQDQRDWAMARKYLLKWGTTSLPGINLLVLLYEHGQISLQPQALDALEDVLTN